MKRRFILTLVGALVLSLLQVPRTIADQVYHSERLDFRLTDEGDAAGHPELRSGHVVNIHPNGPVNGALERYMINGAAANANYQVVILAFTELDCVGDPTLEIPTALLETNAQGNAHGKAKFSRADLDPFSGATVGVYWTLEDEDGVVAYRTDCTVVSID
jgi:hypothetical protein